MSSLPQAAIDKLLFSAEPMSQWKDDTDIRDFAKDLYSPDMIYADKVSYGLELFTEKEKTLREHSRLFTKNLMEASQTSIYRDFYSDALFGQVAKYAIAFKCCISRLLEDAGFYSLAHVLEAENDLECSILLAANCYYKQAIFMLRNILEETFLPIHYCDSVVDFDDWKANNFRTPGLRGNKGLIKRLLGRKIIDISLADAVDNLYKNLSAYVHGSENTLTYRNIHRGEKHQSEFDPGSFTGWCNLFCECSQVCIRLLKVNYDQWNIIRAGKFDALAKVGKTLCHTCHNEEAFTRRLLPEKYCFTSSESRGIIKKADNISFFNYECLKCGQNTLVNAKETSLFIIICASVDDLPSGSAVSSSDIAHLIRGTEDPYCEWYIVQERGKDIVNPLLIDI